MKTRVVLATPHVEPPACLVLIFGAPSVAIIMAFIGAVLAAQAIAAAVVGIVERVQGNRHRK